MSNIAKQKLTEEFKQKIFELDHTGSSIEQLANEYVAGVTNHLHIGKDLHQK